MTSHRIGVNLRVSGNCDQGGRKYMEDYHAIKFVKKDDRDYEFAYFGIFDGHGGPEASRFARDNLLNEITKYDQFWTDNDEDILFAVRSGFLDTHQAMWKELDKWPRTVSGLPSTSGTTASIAIIKKGKLYIGHVGDSGIVLGCDEGPRNAIFMKPKCLTKDHKPDSPEEKERIERSGGSVVSKAGVQRVVWSRPKVNHKGPVRRSTQIDKIPFLAVARSLGDLWSYDYYKGQFVVSPDPDVSVMKIEPGCHRCLVLGSDGLWNMLSPAEAVSVVTDLEMHFEDRVIHDPTVSVSYWINPAEKLVTRALNKWRAKLMKADNISCVVVLIDPLGPSKLTILRKRRDEHFLKLQEAKAAATATHTKDKSPSTSRTSAVSASDPSSSDGSSALKANHNQNNLMGRENQGRDDGMTGGGEEGEEDAGSRTEGSLENKDSHSKDAENNKSKAKGGEEPCVVNAATRNDSIFTGRDITSCSNQTHCHSLRSSSHSPEGASSKVFASRGAASCKGGKSVRATHHADSAVRFPLLPRKLSHPALMPSNLAEMDDSVQATSVLAISPSFNATLSPTSEDPLFLNPEAPSEETPAFGMSMSESLLKLMNLDAIKASSSDPLPKSIAASASLLSQSVSGSMVGKASEVKEQKRHRRSAHGVLQNCVMPHQHSSLPSSARQPHQQQENPALPLSPSHQQYQTSHFSSSSSRQQQHTSLLSSSSRQQHHTSHLSSASRQQLDAPQLPTVSRQQHSTSHLSSSTADLNQTLPPTNPSHKTFHATRSLDSNSFHTTRSLDKSSVSSTRILRLATAQRSSSKSDKPPTDDAKVPSSTDDQLKHGSKSLKVPGLTHSPGGSMVHKVKKRRDFGLLRRTRTTLRRAHRAARKAFCPENRPFLKQLPGSKRKRDEKLPSPDTPSMKRLRRSDGLRVSL